MRDKPTRFYSDRQEKAVAKVIKGKKQANSGAGAWQKGDVQNDNFLVECKTTINPKKSFSIKQEWLETLAEEAIGMRKQGYALCFEFNNADNMRYYVIPERLFLLLNMFMEEENDKD